MSNQKPNQIDESNSFRILLSSVQKIDKAALRSAILFMLAQIILSFLDLLGVALFGLVGAISISGVQTGKPSPAIQLWLDRLVLTDFTFQKQVAILAIAATIVLFLRTAFSVVFSRKSLLYFAHKSAVLSSNLTLRLLSNDLLFLQKRNSQETLFALNAGCNLLYLGLVANAINLVSDLFLLLVLSILAIFFQPQVAILLFLLAIISSISLHFFLNTRARKLGKADAEFSILANMKILESLTLYREIFVHNRRQHYASEVGLLRSKSSSTQAEIAFLPNISRYVVEVTMLVGALAISAVQFILFDVATAVTALSIFLAAGSRLAPALLRVQQGSLAIRNALGGIPATLSLISELNSMTRGQPPVEIQKSDKQVKFSSKIEISNLWLKYPINEHFSLKDINLVIPEKSFVALVGPSASGKTSLVDVILGIIKPTRGEVKISSLHPLQAVNQWPDSISYVPQKIYIADTTLRKNIAIGIADFEIDDTKVLEAIKKAQLEDLLKILPEGLDSKLGEEGNTLSGGQRQRLGIARALYSNPQLIVLDEATSALDGETENLVADSIASTRRSATIIVIAHRLSTVRSADLVCYLEDGELLATGSFEEVRNRIPKFNQQANLMGL